MPEILPPASKGRYSADSPPCGEPGCREAPCARYATDAEGRLLWVDDCWLSLLGYCRDDVIGRPVFDFLTASSRDRARSITMVDLQRVGGVVQEPLQFTMRSGAVLDVLLSMATEDADGKEKSRCVGIIETVAAPRPSASVAGTLQADSVLKVREEALRRSQEFLARVERLARIGGWEMDLATGITVWSDELCRIAGVPAGFSTGMTGGARFIPAEYRQRAIDAGEEARASGDEWDIELPFMRDDGKTIWIRTTGRFEYQNGRPSRVTGTVQDITESHEQRRAIQEARDRIAVATDAGHIGIWDFDVVGNRFNADAWMCRLHGLPPDATYELYDLEKRFMHPEDRARCRKEFEEALAGRRPFEFNYRIVRSDGAVRHMHLAGRVTRGRDDKPLRVIGALWDVTERVEQNRAIEEARNRIAIAADVGGIGIWDYDLEHDLFLLDDWACRLHGFKEGTQHAFSHMVEKSLHPDDREASLRMMQDALAGKCSFEAEYRLVWPDGSIHHVRNVARITRDANGKATHLVGALWDITRQKEQEAALRKSQSFLNRTGHMASIGGWEVDLATSHVNWSEETCRLHGMAIGVTPQLGDVLGRYPPDSAAQLREALSQAIKTGDNWEREVPFMRDGETRWFHLVGSVELIAGRPVRHIGALQDVTEQRRHAEAMRRTLALQTAIFDSADVGIISTDRHGLITSFNHAAQRMLGYREEEMVGVATPLSFHDAAEVALRAEELSRELGRPVAPGFDVFVAHARRDVSEQREWTYIRRDGARFPVMLSVTALHDANHEISGFLGIAADISERKNAEQKLVHLANYDALTGLLNRSSLRREAERLLSAARRLKTSLATIFLDLDRFKEVNDSLGHETGDKLLQLVGMRLKACIRESDTVARLGGDEFVILLPGIGAADEVSVVTQKIQQKFAQPVRLSGHEIFVGVSMGISIFPDDGDDAMQLFRCADSALYQAKAEGRNNVQFYRPELTRRVEEKMRTLTALRHAVANGEFELHFQPIVSLPDATPVGAEALLRWRHPSRGLLAPDAFIAIAEESGLIVPIGEWVIGEACRTAASIDYPRCTNFSVSINVSARQFKSDHLVDVVQKALHESGLDPQRLCLEITEQLLLNDSDRNMATLGAIKALGVRISIDDFGTGYSSLSYIKRFSPDILKIDRSFVMDAASNPDDAAIIKAILAMANSLRIKVVAEGVEDAAQRDFLLQQCCDMAQGYYYSRPINGEDWRAWLARHA